MTLPPIVPSPPNWADQISAWSGLAEAILVGATFVASLIAVNYTRKTWSQADADEKRRRDVEAYNIKVLASAITEDSAGMSQLADAIRRDAGMLLPAFYVMVNNAGPHPIRDLQVHIDRALQKDSWREVVEGILGWKEDVTDLAGHTKAYFVRPGADSRDPLVPVVVSFEDQYGQRWTIDDKGRRAKVATVALPESH